MAGQKQKHIASAGRKAESYVRADDGAIMVCVGNMQIYENELAVGSRLIPRQQSPR